MKGNLLLLAVLAAPLLAGGCGQKSGPALGAGDTQAFDKAPPEVKQVWDRALEAERTNGYVLAQKLLYGLSQQQLPPEQKDAVTKETAAINKRLYDAAEKGDAAALKAIQELRRNPPNR
jgi:hypothetical protein